MRLQTLIYSFPFIFLLTACGGGNQSQQTEQEQATKAKTQNVRTVDIMGVDQMKYVVKEEGELIGTAGTVKTSSGETYLQLQNIEADPGEKLCIRLNAISDMPASAMAHNWILLKQDVDSADFVKAATQAKANDYIPQDRTGDIIAHTDLAAGGETMEVTFTVPEKTGEYDYLCSFPGHFSAGMHGKFIVQ